MANIHSKMVEFVSENMDICDLYEYPSEPFNIKIIAIYLNEENKEMNSKMEGNNRMITPRDPTIDDIYESAETAVADIISHWLKGQTSWISGFYEWVVKNDGKRPGVMWAGYGTFGNLSKKMRNDMLKRAEGLDKYSDKINRASLVDKAHRLTHRLGGAGKTTMVKWGDFEGRSS